MQDVEDSVNLLQEISERFKSDIYSQRSARKSEFLQKHGSRLDSATIFKETMEKLDADWQDITLRVGHLPGKEVFAALCGEVQTRYRVSLSASKVIAEFRSGEVPQEISLIVRRLERLRLTPLEP